MSDRPTEFVFDANPLRVMVETAPGSRLFQADPRARVEKLVLGSNDIMSQAVVQVYAGPIETDPPGSEDSLDPCIVLAGGFRSGFGPFIGPDQEIRIYRDAFPTGSEILFAGYCRSPRYDESGGPGSGRTLWLVVRSMLEAMSTEETCQIHGRYMRTAEAQDEMDGVQLRDSDSPHGDADSVFRVVAERCVFNAKGKPNRAAAPIEVAVASGGGDEMVVETRSVHVFAPDGDPDAKMWTFAQALRYLLYFHLPPYSWWGDGNLFPDTEGLIAQSASDRPPAPVSDADAFRFAMLGEPRDVDCGNLNLPEALIVVANAARVRFRLAAEPDILTEPSNLLWFGARGCGPVKTISKHASLDMRGLTASESLALDTAKDLTLQAVYEDVITRPIFRGDVRRYEVTVELVPGWLPDSNVDDVPDADAATDFAEAHWDLDEVDIQYDPWFIAYHKAGSDFENHADVGRRWVLNETGRYSEKPGIDYARDTGLYTSGAYIPWEPSSAFIRDRRRVEGEWADERVEEGAWSRRPRPFQHCLSADTKKRSFGIYVEFSFDAGSTWHHIPECRIMNLQDEAGIYIDADDLSTIVMPGGDPQDPETMYFWQAMLTNVARVRVTAVIEGDDALVPELGADGFQPAIVFATSKVFDVSQQYHCNRRDNANSIFGPLYASEDTNPSGEREAPDETVETLDDTERLHEAAEGVLDLLAGRQNIVAAAIPWLTTDYEPMDSVASIDGMSYQLVSHGAGRDQQLTDIVAVEYVGSHTRLVFEDERTLMQLEA